MSSGWRAAVAQAAVFLVSLQGGDVARADERVPLTVSDAIETARPVVDADLNPVFISPNGRRFAFALVRGDVTKNGVWMELYVGELTSLERASAKLVARLFASGLGPGPGRERGSDELVWQTTNSPVWVDNERLAVLWENDRTIWQVVAVAVDTHEITYLTNHPTDVLSFARGPKGQIFYTAAPTRVDAQSGNRARDGFVVDAADAWRPLGQDAGIWDYLDNERYITTTSGQRKVAFARGDSVSRFPPRTDPVFSSDGRLALLPNTRADVPSEWMQYTDRHFQDMLAERVVAPDGGYARQFQSWFVVNLDEASAYPLWEVPLQTGTPHAAWSPSGRTVLLAPTFLPTSAVDSTGGGLAGNAVAEVEIASGRFWQLPVPSAFAEQIARLRWLGPDRVEMTTGDKQRLVLYKKEGRWQRSPGSGKPIAPWKRERLAVELRQGLNTPPAFFVVDTKTGRDKLVFDPNPDLRSGFTLGNVEWLQRCDRRGSRVQGRLYYPVGFQRGQRYPLVVQTHTFAAKDEFSIYGPGGAQPALGPSYSVYAAQLLANRGFLVLHAGIEQSSLLPYLTRVKNNIDALEDTVEGLVADGLVDRTRVGIMGFSASGFQVEYAIAHSQFPYAAAIADDNKDGSYLQAALSGWGVGTGDEMIGATPFGAGLYVWLRESPAFNAERIRAPVMLVSSSSQLLLQPWEIFSRLRYLKKPVEYFVVPNVTHGSHGLQNPGQVSVLKQRAIDWWTFWLKGEQRSGPDSEKQFEAWRRLRLLHAPSANAPQGESESGRAGSGCR